MEKKEIQSERHQPPAGLKNLYSPPASAGFWQTGLKPAGSVKMRPNLMWREKKTTCPRFVFS